MNGVDLEQVAEDLEYWYETIDVNDITEQDISALWEMADTMSDIKRFLKDIEHQLPEEVFGDHLVYDTIQKMSRI